MNAPHLPFPGGPSPDAFAARRRSELAREARCLSRRRQAAEAVAARCLRGDRPSDPDQAARIARKALRRAALLRSRFHRVLDALVNVDGFDEALRAFRERNDRWHRGDPKPRS
jgi:hypothetical protein